jgi:hypothetical protein
MLRDPNKFEMAASRNGASRNAFRARAYIELGCQVSLSILLVVAGFVVMRSPGSTHDMQKVASGWIGVVVGYWLR